MRPSLASGRLPPSLAVPATRSPSRTRGTSSRLEPVCRTPTSGNPFVGHTNPRGHLLLRCITSNLVFVLGMPRVRVADPTKLALPTWQVGPDLW